MRNLRSEAEIPPSGRNDSMRDNHTSPELFGAIRVSYYKTKKDGLVLVATNFGKTAADADIRLDLKALGLPAKTTARDLLSKEPVETNGGTLKLRLEPWLVRFVQVR